MYVVLFGRFCLFETTSKESFFTFDGFLCSFFIVLCHLHSFVQVFSSVFFLFLFLKFFCVFVFYEFFEFI